MTTLDIETLAVDGQQFHPEAFPLVYSLKTGGAGMEDVKAWIASEGARPVNQLAVKGAILFRDFPVEDANDFDAFIRAFGLSSFTYEESLSNAVRVNRTELVFTANEAPPDVADDRNRPVA